MDEQRTRVLIVDDDAAARMTLAQLLEMTGYEVAQAHDSDSALRGLEGRPSVMLIEPDIQPDGWELARRLHTRRGDLPLIFVSRRTDEIDRVYGLKLGADDYVAKPYGLAELLARMEAVLRRNGGAVEVEPASSYSDRIVTIDFDRHEVIVRGVVVNLSPTEYRLLLCLVDKAGRVVTAEDLMHCAWKDQSGSLEQVKIYIGYLRKKMELDPSAPRLIQTVRGAGYRYERRLEE